ncbi:hypothetical protein BDR26DRAFT_921664 [Obelidium mucronatum]|nr:hypothetical protein BDR26DRAFT_921664 [Obelidium mucronatum]
MVKDADRLFETRSVADVRVLESKMGADIEQKKKDLRMMVGDRYRDLIDAADSVAQMQTASLELQSLLAGLARGCSADEARAKAAAEAALAKGSGDRRERDQAAAYPVAVQIKLLVDTPEQIWHCLETNLFLRASRLWQAAHSIHRNLQRAEDSTASSNIPLSFPIVQRQWDSIKQFESKILDKSREYIKSTSISSQNVTDSLCAIMLLERISSKHVLGAFLAHRKLAMSETLKAYSSTKSSTSISDLLTRLTNVLQITLFQVAIIFSPLEQQQQSLLESTIASICKTPTPSDSGAIPINSMYHLYSEKTNMHVVFRHLPIVIQNHVPLFVSDKTAISKDAIRTLLDAWLLDVTNEVKIGVFNVLSHVSVGSQLATIRETLLKSLSEFERADSTTTTSGGNEDWGAACAHLLDRKVSLWEEVYRSVFKELSLRLIESSFGGLVNQVQTVLAPLVKSCTTLNSEDSSVADYIWTAPNSGNNKTGIRKSDAVPELLCRVQTSSLGSITDSFERGLEEMKADVIPLVTPNYSMDKKRRGSTASQTRVLADNEEVHVERDIESFVSFFQDHYLKAISQYEKSLLVLLADVAKLEGPTAIAQTVFIARVAKALAIKIRILGIPVLRDESHLSNNNTTSSIVARLKQRSIKTKDAAPTGLDATQSSLMDVHLTAMKTWIIATCDQFESNMAAGLAAEDWKNGTKFLGVWESVSISAQTEAPEDMIKLPVHASSFIVQSLFLVSSELNRLNGFILEKPCLKVLMHELAHRIVKVYQNFLDKVLPSIPNPSDKSYLQILFDYDFLIKVVDGCWVYDGDHLSSSSNSNAASDIGKDTKVPVLSVLALIRSLIDPIDLAVASSHHMANVDRCYYRTSVLLGALLALNPKPTELKKTLSVQEVHNVIAMANQPPRFTMLLTSLPGATLPAVSRARGTFSARSSGSQLDVFRPSQNNNNTQQPRRSHRSKIKISANSIANSHGKENTNNTSYSISGSVLSGVVGLVGAAANTAQMAGMSQRSLFGGSSMFGIFGSNQTTAAAGVAAVAASSGTGATTTPNSSSPSKK